jgi:hypothetical protein
LLQADWPQRSAKFFSRALTLKHHCTMDDQKKKNKYNYYFYSSWIHTKEHDGQRDFMATESPKADHRLLLPNIHCIIEEEK